MIAPMRGTAPKVTLPAVMGASVLVILAVPVPLGGCGSADGERRPRPTAPQVSVATPMTPRTGAAMRPGEYESARLRPSVRFRVGAGWGAGYDEPTHLDLFGGNRNRQLSFLTGLRGAPSDVVRRLDRVRGFRVAKVRRGGFSSYEGLRFDARVAGADPVIFDALDFYTVRAGQRFRAWVVRAGRRTVIGAVQAGGDFDEFVVEAKRVMDTARFG